MSFFRSLGKIVQVATFNYFGFGFLANWLTPKTPQVDPQALQNPPTAKQGDVIRIVGGRFRIEQSNCTDWGDVQITAVKAKSGKKG